MQNHLHSVSIENKSVIRISTFYRVKLLCRFKMSKINSEYEISKLFAKVLKYPLSFECDTSNNSDMKHDLHDSFESFTCSSQLLLINTPSPMKLYINLETRPLDPKTETPRPPNPKLCITKL